MNTPPRYLSLLVALLATACGSLQAPNSTPTSKPEDFNFKTTQDVQLEVEVRSLGEAAAGAPVRVFQGFLPDGSVDESKQMLSGSTNAQGFYRAQVTLPSDLKEVGVRVDYIGVINEPIKVSIKEGKARVRLDDQTITALNVMVPRGAPESPGVSLQNVTYSYRYLGGFGNWNSLGVPSNLTTPSTKLTADMLRTINATLPEGSPLPSDPTRSRYIARDAISNLVLKDPAEVWLTFVHEGAGYLNAVGYYLYPAANPPRTVNEILSRMIMAYPNASYQGSGGGLQSGNRVKLRHFDTATQTWSDVFPAGTGIGWFLVANGWRNSSTGVLERSAERSVFSDPLLNHQLYAGQGMTVANSAQTVLLYDDNRQTLILGLEDILRHRGGDQDFNDAVLLVEANPYTAVQKTNIVVRDPANPDLTRTADLAPSRDPTTADTDSDGANDTFDAYPADPARAFNNYFPAKNDFGTLAFEDLWPRRGDYDFNDMVVDYNINHVTNAGGQLVQIQAEFVLRALGGGWHNGLAFSTDLLPSQVASVSYQWEKNGSLQAGAPPIHYTQDRNPNGTEAGQSKAVFIVFDNGYDLLEPSVPSRPFYSNVVPTEPTKVPGRVRMTINLTSPLAASAPGAAPYNPFIIANPVRLQDGRYVPVWSRGMEIHLAGYRPTAKANTSLYGTGDDTSNPTANRFYIDSFNRPWGLHLPTQYTYLREVLNQPNGWVSLGLDIRVGYLNFDTWALSNGANSKDWYRDLPGYRDVQKLFVAP